MPKSPDRALLRSSLNRIAQGLNLMDDYDRLRVGKRPRHLRLDRL
jgi:hypothetical protein